VSDVYPNEEWRDIPRSIGYQASNLGRIRSRWVSGKGRRGSYLGDAWHVLKPHRMANGKQLVSILVDGVRKTRSVHQLVLEAFVGPRPPDMECRHLDGNPANNRLDNLAWGTHQENIDDKRRHGTNRYGEDHPLSYLTEADVVAIRERRAAGERVGDISRSTGIERSLISMICLGRTWANAPGPITKTLRGRDKPKPAPDTTPGSPKG
jgi:hypothetical protein